MNHSFAHGRIWQSTGFLMSRWPAACCRVTTGQPATGRRWSPGRTRSGAVPRDHPPPRSGGHGTDVGALPAKYYVGANGEFSYVVPLWTRPAATTSSRSCRSPTRAGIRSESGQGWTVRGLGSPAVSHASSRLDRPAPLRWDGEGHFCLNGTPLVLVSGHNAEQGAEYRTEPDTFARVTVLRADPLGPLEFEVRSREGRIDRYGSEDAARVEGHKVSWSIDQAAPRSTPPGQTFQKVRFSWLHAATENRHGNRIEVQYQHPAQARQEGGYQEPLPTGHRLRLHRRRADPPGPVLLPAAVRARLGPAGVRGRPQFPAHPTARGDRDAGAQRRCGPTVRHYRFAYQASPATKRPLLETMRSATAIPGGRPGP